MEALAVRDGFYDLWDKAGFWDLSKPFNGDIIHLKVPGGGGMTYDTKTHCSPDSRHRHAPLPVCDGRRASTRNVGKEEEHRIVITNTIIPFLFTELGTLLRLFHCLYSASLRAWRHECTTGHTGCLAEPIEPENRRLGLWRSVRESPPRRLMRVGAPSGGHCGALQGLPRTFSASLVRL